MVVYRYSSLHLAAILLAGVFVASSLLFCSLLVSILAILCGLVSYVLVTILCYHQSGDYPRTKLESFMLFLLAYYNSGTIPPRNKRTINTSVGPISAHVHFESQKIVKLIVRDFVTSWYSTISTNRELPQEVIRILQHLVLQLHLRIQVININDIVLGILPIINPFITTLNEVGYYSNDNGPPIYDVNHPSCVISLEKNPRLTHPALKSSITEIHYLQKLVDSFLISSIPSQYRKCDIVLQLIRNILVYRVFRPVFDLICDPLFLLEVIPMILSKIPNDKLLSQLHEMDQENAIIERELSTENGLLDSIISYHTRYQDIHDFGNEEADLPDMTEADEEQLQQLIQSVSAATEELVMIPLPSVYISKYVSVDTKDGVHTGYIIKFPRSLLDDEQLMRLGITTSPTSSTVDEELESLKRFSEFTKLHKLLTKSSLASLIKGASLPDKRIISNLWSRVSLTDPDPALVLERKEGLDKYIQALSNIPEVRDSLVFKEFLESGVSVLQDATIVTKKSRKPSMLELKKTAQCSFDIDAQDIQSILDIFIDMQVLLPCCDLLAINTAPPTNHTLTPPTTQSVTPLMSSSNHSLTPPTNGHVNIMSWLQGILLTDYSDSDALKLSCHTKAPLFSCILSLANDATMKTIPDLWLTNTSTQLALINVFGKTIDSFLWKELHEVVYDDSNWARMLYNLRHTLWPNGELTDFNKQKLTQQQKDNLRKKSIKAIKDFLPNLLPILIGGENYNTTINHCLDTIQNTKINRHLLYHIVDLLFSNIVPQFNEKDFQQCVFNLRSKPLFVA